MRLSKHISWSLTTFVWVCLTSTFLALAASLLRSQANHTYFGSDGLWVADYGFDYFDYYTRFLARHSVGFFTQPGYPWYYPAPALLVHYPYYVVAHRTQNLLLSYWLFVGTIALCAIVLGISFARFLEKAGLPFTRALLFSFLCVFSSYPLYFAAQRGNIEGVTWIFVCAFVFLLLRGDEIQAATLLGVAGSIKIYPFLFGALFLKRRRWHLLFWTALTAVVVTILALHLLEPSIGDSFSRVLNGVHQWTVAYGEVYRDPEWDHSLFGLFKLCFHNSVHTFHEALLCYYALAGLIASVVYLLRIRKMPFANQILFLTCAAVSLPPTSFDYTLTALYVPFALIAASAVHQKRGTPQDRALLLPMVCFGLLLTPTTYLELTSLPGLPGAAKAICLVALLIAACVTPFEAGPAFNGVFNTGF